MNVTAAEATLIGAAIGAAVVAVIAVFQYTAQARLARLQLFELRLGAYTKVTEMRRAVDRFSALGEEPFRSAYADQDEAREWRHAAFSAIQDARQDAERVAFLFGDEVTAFVTKALARADELVKATSNTLPNRYGTLARDEEDWLVQEGYARPEPFERRKARYRAALSEWDDIRSDAYSVFEAYLGADRHLGRALLKQRESQDPMLRPQSPYTPGSPA